MPESVGLPEVLRRVPAAALLMRHPMKERDLVLDLLAFAGTVTAATVFRWQARDVIWGLWISSLTVGYATIVMTVVRGVRALAGSYRLLAVIGGLGTLAFFTFHFGMFHFVHGVFLNGFFPLLESESGFPNIFSMAGRSFALFWPLVLASFVSRLPDILPGPPRPERAEADTAAGRQAALPSLGKDSFAGPYANVVRMHILIFVFAGLHVVDLSRLAIIPVLAAYFFPWKAAIARFRDGS
jgi:hypothetical protein